jgi:hypothetical protein
MNNAWRGLVPLDGLGGPTQAANARLGTSCKRARTGRNGSDRTVDSQIKTLCRRLSELMPDEELIRSVYGVGYRFSAVAQVPVPGSPGRERQRRRPPLARHDGPVGRRGLGASGQKRAGTRASWSTWNPASSSASRSGDSSAGMPSMC